MEPSDFFTASRVLIVAGKGGVGKTTVAATLALAASRLGIDTLLVEVEGKRGLDAMFDQGGSGTTDGLSYVEKDIETAHSGPGSGRLRARTISAGDALLDYLDNHGLRGLARSLTRLRVLDTLATSTPGLKDLIVLGKIKHLEVSDAAGLIIVDAPASGHAISFLRSASSLQQTVDTGPIAQQAAEVTAMLTDPTRASVLLVTLAEETPVNELIETAYALEDEVGIRLGPVVVNALYSNRHDTEGSQRIGDAALAAEVAAASSYWMSQVDGQQAQVTRLSRELPLEQISLPRALTTRIGPAELEQLATRLLDEVANLRFEGQP